MAEPEIYQRIIDTVTKTPKVEKIILFGSRARGDQEIRSDIDIAIICPKVTEREWVEICDRIDDINTLLSIDVTRFDTASSELQKKILEQGVILYER